MARLGHADRHDLRRALPHPPEARRRRDGERLPRRGRRARRRVAIKILNDRYANDDLFVERFRREAKSAAGLSHPNIVSIYDRGEAEGTYYIAMEVIEGAEPQGADPRARPPPPGAGDRLHAPDPRGAAVRAPQRDHPPRHQAAQHPRRPEERLKVTDFGIARAGASQMTEAGSIMGTAQYLSPEQARGRQVTAPPTSTRSGSSSTRC